MGSWTYNKIMWNIDLRITRTGASLNIICKGAITGFIILCQKPSDPLCFGSIKLHFPKVLALQLHSKIWSLRPNLYVTQKTEILNYHLRFLEAKCWSNPANLYAGFSGNLDCVNPYWDTEPIHSISLFYQIACKSFFWWCLDQNGIQVILNKLCKFCSVHKL